MNEAHLLFGSVVVLSSYLIFLLLDAGLLGRLSFRYFELRNRVEQIKKLELAAAAEKATLHFKPTDIVFRAAKFEEAKQKFEKQIEAVPVDEATGEAIIEGKQFINWTYACKEALKDRGTEAIINFRKMDFYYRDTFCKMSQGLASSRAWKEAQEAQQACDREFSEITEWAGKLAQDWDRQILQGCSKLADVEFQKEMEKAQKDQQKLMEENERKARERSQARINAAKKKEEELAQAAEAELLNDLAEEKKKKNNQKGKKGST